MRKTLLATAIAGVISTFALPMAAQAEEAASPHTFTGNFTLASEYLYRGIAQTRGKPAIQGGFDYSHSSGFYIGTWASNITWISDAVSGASAGIEIDVYGGYKGAINSDWGYDVGVLTYNYPGSGKTNSTVPQDLKQDTTEIYGAVSYKWLTLKYSQSTTALFGFSKNPGASTDKTKGSGYLELNATYDLGNGWGISGHAGHQKVKGNSFASYSDYKVGVTKDVGFGVVGLAVSGTNAKDDCNNTATNPYCLVNGSNANNKYEGGKTRAVLTFGKTF